MAYIAAAAAERERGSKKALVLAAVGITQADDDMA
jgi:hypothetical protein